MKNDFENEFVEPADPNFTDRILQQLAPGRTPGDTNTFFLELVRGHPHQKPFWFVLNVPPNDKQGTTLQVIQITAKRIK